MARIKLGYTPEQLEQEEANWLRKQEEEIQHQNQLHQKKLRQLVIKERRNKILVTSIAGLLILCLLIFGTFNTFFKKQLKQDDVKQIVEASVNHFPVEGIYSFVRNNFEGWFKEFSSFTKDGENGLSYVLPSLTTLTLDNIVPVSNTLSKVYFSVDIITKHPDVKKDDKTVTKGLKKTTRYSFYMPIEYRGKYDNAGNLVSAGYVPVAPMSFYLLVPQHSSQFSEDSAYLVFTSEIESSEILESAKIKVDKIFNDLYENKDTSQDFLSYLPFNTELGAKYEGIDEFKMYKEPNALGFNAVIKYTIRTADGFKYQNQHFLSVVKNGNTWLINGIQ